MLQLILTMKIGLNRISLSTGWLNSTKSSKAMVALMLLLAIHRMLNIQVKMFNIASIIWKQLNVAICMDVVQSED